MRALFVFILFGNLLILIQSRPSSHSDENNEGREEIEYEGDSDAQTLDQDNIEGSRFRDDDPTSQEVEQNRRLLELNRNTYLHKNLAEDGAAQSNAEISDYKPLRTRDIRNDHSNAVANEEFQTYGKRRQFNKYMESNDAKDQLEAAQHLTNRDVNNFKLNRMHNSQIVENPLSKRTVDSRTAPTEEGELLFENNRDQVSKIDKNDFNVESYETNQRPYYNSKQSYNQMHPDSRDTLNSNNRNNERIYYNRDRRAAKKTKLKESEENSENNNLNVGAPNENLEKIDNENEEMAIRRHIKKLSETELEELFNSLSEEKRALLKKIIDDTDAPENTDGINKREITKKAGAVEDNGYVELGQSESSKIQSGPSPIDMSTEYPSQSSEMSQATKQSESTILSNEKSPQETNSDAKLELKNNSEEKTDVGGIVANGEANKNQAEVAASEQATSKTENKRETNVEDVPSAPLEDKTKFTDDDFAKQSDVVGYFSTQDEDLSQFLDDETGYDGSKVYKRDIEKQSDLENKLKSLEESFPNPESYDDPAPYSGPLVRVKRKNVEKNIKKRAAAILSDSKVGFFPYKEADVEDSDEGSEFDDDGFYDPSPNFASKDNKAADKSQQTRVENANCVLNTVDHAKTPNAENSDTTSLGSDTDNVLSGVEGVDENLMFISGNRNRRKTEGNLSQNEGESNHIQVAYGKTSDDTVKDSLNNNLNIPNYQESDSFGGLPHNYEGDLGRYKRIRRLKQSHAYDNETSSNT